MIQGRLAKLQEKEANIRTTLISIQYILLQHMEVMKHEIFIVEALMTRDANVSTKEELIALVATLEI